MRSDPLTPASMKPGAHYNWIGQADRLIYLRCFDGWHQFKKIGDPREVWCEVRDADLHMLEETPVGVGDTVECDLRWPRQHTIRLALETKAAADYANNLLAKHLGWRRVMTPVAASDMPNVDDLMAIARAAFEAERGERKSPRSPVSDLAFAQRELVALGRGDVYDAEFRRHELLLRGLTPPDE